MWIKWDSLPLPFHTEPLQLQLRMRSLLDMRSKSGLEPKDMQLRMFNHNYMPCQSSLEL
jgi:hypothetical protein